MSLRDFKMTATPPEKTLVKKVDLFAEEVGTDVGLLKRQVEEMRSKGVKLNVARQPVLQQTESQVESLPQAPERVSQSGTSFGVDRYTGQLISGWNHTQQSIQVIFETRLGARLIRRWFGSEVPDLQDAPGVEETFVAYYVAIAEALDKFEPRFELKDMQVVKAGSDGKFSLEMLGIYYPRGHLGDFITQEPKFTTAYL